MAPAGGRVKKVDLDSESAQDSLATQLAAVELLLRRQDRDVARDDILVATVFELLEQGDLPTPAIHQAVTRVWPGVVVTSSEIGAVLTTAESIRHVQRRDQLDGTEVWSLLPAARNELDTARTWASSVETRFRSQLADEARLHFGDVRYEELDLWLGITIKALRECISRSFSPEHFGGIDTISGQWLHPSSINLDECLNAIDRVVRDATSGEFLKSAVTLALEPSASFGSELVHHLVTGYLLYFFMAAKRAADHTGSAGPLVGERLVLDTPVLFHMTKPASQATAISELIAIALNIGMEVVLYERTVAEFEGKLDNHATFDVSRIEQDLRSGVDSFLLAELLRAEELLRNWLLWLTNTGGTWSDYRGRIDGPAGPVATLRAMGVSFVSDSSFQTVADTGRYEQFKAALTRAVTMNGKPTRSDRVIDHDAGLLLEAHHGRLANPATEQKIWPGGFILSTDNRLNDAFDSVVGFQTIPVALSFSAFGAIAASYASPRHSEDLAFKIASEMTEVAIMSRSTTIPLDLARQLATALSGENKPRPVDVQQLQFNVSTLLRTHPDLFEKAGEEFEGYVGEIVARRRTRLTDARAREEEQIRKERHRAELVQTRQQEELLAERRLRQEAEKTLKATSAALETTSNEVERVAQEGRRKAVLAGLSAAIIVVMVIFLLAGKVAAASFLLFSCVILGGTGWGWATRDGGSWPVVVASTSAAIGGIWGVFFH